MVPTDVFRAEFNGDGTTTEFAFSFPYYTTDTIKAVIVDVDGSETTLTSDYYVNPVNNTVTYPGYPPGAEPPEADRPPKLQTGQKLIVYRDTPITQLADLGEKWPFNVTEKGLDKLTMILQERSYDALRSVVGIEGSGATITYTRGNGETGTVTVNNVANATNATNADYATTAGSAGTATNDGNGNNIANTYLKLSGGTMSGQISMNGQSVNLGANSSDNGRIYPISNYLRLVGGSNTSTGSWIDIGTPNATITGFRFAANDTVQSKELIGMPDGTLTWGGVSVALADDAQDRVEWYFNPQGPSTTGAGYEDHQGECNIIKAYGKVIMIDTADASKSAWIKTWLTGLGITKIDYLIISHYHGDHVNGLTKMTYLDWSGCTAYLPTMVPNASYVKSADSYNSVSGLYTNTINFLTSKGVTMIYPNEGNTLTIGSNFKITFLNCNKNTEVNTYITNWINGVNPNYEREYNNYSMVAKVDHGNVTVVYSGDIEAPAQKRMFDKQFYLNVNVYKHHHHGYEYNAFVPYCNTINPDILINQGHIDYYNGLIINTDLRYFVDKKLLLPTSYQVKLVSNGNTLHIQEGPEEYKWKNRHVLNLSPNTDRIYEGGDLNNYVMGTFSFSSGEILTSCSNAPSDWTYGNGRLISIYNLHTGYSVADGEDGYITQIIVGANTNGIMYMRTQRGTDGWTGWTRFVSTNDIGTIASSSKSTDTSISDSTETGVLSVSLTKGTWIVTGHVCFKSTTAGIRYSVNVGTSNNTFNEETDGAVTNFAHANNNYISMQTSRTFTLNSSGNVYLNVYCTSASTLKACDLKAVKVAP